VQAIILLGTPLLAKLPARIGFFKDHLEQRVVRLTSAPPQFGYNPIPTPGLKCLPPNGLRDGWCITSHIRLFRERPPQEYAFRFRLAPKIAGPILRFAGPNAAPDTTGQPPVGASHKSMDFWLPEQDSNLRPSG
jgi:hypothetical protein